MKLYVNGDSHSAGAEAVNTYCFAEDDGQYLHLGRKPHPDNLKVSYGQKLAEYVGADFICHAESGSSNHRILRTTYDYLLANNPDLVIIGWATWEREEVVIDEVAYQFGAGLQLDCWPPIPEHVKQRYKEWVIDRHNVNQYCEQAQNDIWQLHQHLKHLKIPHLFFNTYSSLSVKEHLDWGNSYHQPYQHDQSYFKLLKAWGYSTVATNSYHYGVDAHQAWADFLIKNYLTNVL